MSEKMKFKNITINLDKRRKPLNSTDRKKISVKKLYPYCGANNILDYVDEYLFDEEILCIAEDGGKWGKNEVCSYIMKEKCWVNNHAHVVKVKENIDIRYLKYWLNHANLDSYITGAIVRKLTQKQLNELELVIPNKSEQVKIANKMDKIQSIVEIKRKQFEKLDELIKSQFVEMFENRNYEKLSGKELFSFSSGKFLEASKRLENGVPVYGGNGVAWYTDEPLIDFNTIVIGRVGAYCGNVKLIKEPVWITDNAIFIKQFKKDVYNIDFLYYMMELVDFSRFAQFSGQPKITQKPLEEFNYVVPPIEEQIKFSNIVKQIDKQKFEIENSLKEMQELYESLMEKYFG